jgi:hypothetical protein
VRNLNRLTGESGGFGTRQKDSGICHITDGGEATFESTLVVDTTQAHGAQKMLRRIAFGPPLELIHTLEHCTDAITFNRAGKDRINADATCT